MQEIGVKSANTRFAKEPRATNIFSPGMNPVEKHASLFEHVFCKP